MIIKKKHLRPQDVLMALGILYKGNNGWNYHTMSSFLGISPSTSFESIPILVYANLLIKEKNRLLLENFKEVLFYGLKFFFPVRPGEVTRGVPALSSAPFLSGIISSTEAFVWPYDKGTLQGQSIVPLCKSIPRISLENEELWKLFTFTDFLRCGNAREKMQAREYFENLMSKYEQQQS
ncbi:MAG: hypothetical protein V1913_13115 [Fibrobacterota bacterium]